MFLGIVGEGNDCPHTGVWLPTATFYAIKADALTPASSNI